MRILYLDCGMGAAGDMLQGALVSLLDKEDQKSFISLMNDISVDGVTVSLEDDVKCGITGQHITVKVNGEEEESLDVHDHEHHHDEEHRHHHEHNHDHNHHHDDSHHSHHHHASMHEIEHVISHLNISNKIKNDMLSIYKIIAEAESKVHGKSVEEVHFHEVGMKDALTDILGNALLMDKLGVDKVVVSPINVGFGKVKCAHGILPVPAPATAEILNGMPTYAGRFEGEMCTPTGAALLKYYADEFAKQPLMKIVKTGYGCGNKDFEAANVVRATLGESFDSSEECRDRVIELKCNIDDMTGEEMSYAVDILFENNVKDAFVTPVVMKKGRSGMLLTVLCSEQDKEKIASLIFKHTSTIGIRESVMERMILKRREETVQTEYGDVPVKVTEGFSVKKTKAEFDSLKEIAIRTGKSINEVRKIVENNQ
ncbi:MAG: nickel pincer cofactor biosynthesis protein LarC [Lachnospiraceae bacterium]|nr:nickel pincer cofactor biosynthesis protein LarC [Lachnospiraceae bacterium]